MKSCLKTIRMVLFMAGFVCSSSLHCTLQRHVTLQITSAHCFSLTHFALQVSHGMDVVSIKPDITSSMTSGEWNTVPGMRYAHHLMHIHCDGPRQHTSIVWHHLTFDFKQSFCTIGSHRSQGSPLATTSPGSSTSEEITALMQTTA